MSFGSLDSGYFLTHRTIRERISIRYSKSLKTIVEGNLEMTQLKFLGFSFGKLPSREDERLALGHGLSEQQSRNRGPGLFVLAQCPLRGNVRSH